MTTNSNLPASSVKEQMPRHKQPVEINNVFFHHLTNLYTGLCTDKSFLKVTHTPVCTTDLQPCAQLPYLRVDNSRSSLRLNLSTILNGPVHRAQVRFRSEEHTSELQSRPHLVCRLLLEKKN